MPSQDARDTALSVALAMILARQLHQLFSGVRIENLEAALINTGLQPGATDSTKNKPFQRFACEEKPFKRLVCYITCNTRLKPCVNETSKQMIYLRRLRPAEIIGTLRSLPHCNKRRYD